ncbi:MAG: M24 family metallopeptidase, partial [Bacteroidales bacterium]
EMVKDAGLTEYFMGYDQQAAFVGHGIGIEVNELPILFGRSKDILQVGNVFALEPKFVIPRVGAVGIENSYVVTENGIEKLTQLEEEIIELPL